MILTRLLSLCMGLCVCLPLSRCFHNPVVKTPLGDVRGLGKTSHKGKLFSIFQGIPYAKPPTGNKRFEPPEPTEPWDYVWNAYFVMECAQNYPILVNGTTGTEDCLYLNVYVPREHPNSEDNLDVIVHIHAGGFMLGYGNLYARPEFLMDHEVILVTFNYRLGILGFLSTEDDVVPGNNGLKDQVMALKWVQENIASFGGNPGSVTIFGLSAGGASVQLHYLSEMSKGLFHRGFSQSGVALNSWALQEEPLSKAKLLADAVDCPTESSTEMVKCLKQRPYKQLLDKLSLFFAYKFLPVSPFAPVVESGPNPFLKDYPYNLLKKKQVMDLPWIASNVAHEGVIPASFLQDFETLNSKWDELAPFLLDFNYTLPPVLWKNTSNKIKDFYFGKDQGINVESFPKLVQLCSDRLFVFDAENAVRWQAAATKSPVYYHWFNYLGDNNTDKYVGHGNDAKYYFGNVFLSSGPLTENELKMKDIVVEMLVSFAKTGKPTVKTVNWEPTKGENLTYLNITSFKPEDIQVQTVDEITPGKFWNSLGFLENEHLSSVKL